MNPLVVGTTSRSDDCAECCGDDHALYSRHQKTAATLCSCPSVLGYTQSAESSKKHQEQKLI